MTHKQKFLVYRKDIKSEFPNYVHYEVPITKGMSVLEALFYIQDHFDSTLAFRFACRGAICGSCGMTIDKIPRLACKTQVLDVKSMRKPKKLPEFTFGNISGWNEEEEILIEPLPNLKVIKDLVVDMDQFWEFFKEIQPYFIKTWKDSAPESYQDPNDHKIIEHLVYCILCACCWACPVNAKDPKYLGPAQLAKAYRFIADTRLDANHRAEIVTRVSKDDAVPSCNQYFVCNRVCPKNVKPGTAIKNIREQWIK